MDDMKGRLASAKAGAVLDVLDDFLALPERLLDLELKEHMATEAEQNGETTSHLDTAGY